LAQYLAGQLSQRINEGHIPNIEGAFLWRKHIRDLDFDNQGTLVRSSVTGAFDLSMFRLR
jgi:hypothetical protein